MRSIFLKTKHIFVASLAAITLLGGCAADNASSKAGAVDLINDEFPEAQEEIMEIMNGIVESVMDGDVDMLISYHAYGPKFTEFKDGEVRNDGKENEAYERNVFGAVTEVIKFDVNDMKIAVYGDVANVTMHTDFHLMFGENLGIVKDQLSLMFVNTNEGWKIVHEHHSPLNAGASE